MQEKTEEECERNFHCTRRRSDPLPSALPAHSGYNSGTRPGRAW